MRNPDAIKVRYGRINMPMIRSLLQIKREDDGPFWAVNLMKCRQVADYGDGRTTKLRGREADDEYTPLDSLAGIGAKIVFAADVEQISVGDGVAWDRIGIVRYPSQRQFLEMQQREDFKKSHVHKDASIEFTIVLSCLPITPFNGPRERHDFVELRVAGEATRDSARARSAHCAAFSVEGVIVGDDRRWSEVSFRWLPSGEQQKTAARSAVTDDPNLYVMLLRPSIDRLTRSVVEPEAVPAAGAGDPAE